MGDEIDGLSGVSKIFGQGVAAAAAEGATGLGLLAGGFKAVAIEA